MIGRQFWVPQVEALNNFPFPNSSRGGTENCCDKSPFRGACFFSKEKNDTPVNARHREIGGRAFDISGSSSIQCFLAALRKSRRIMTSFATHCPNIYPLVWDINQAARRKINPAFI